MFSPISYLVTTSGYDQVLAEVMRESVAPAQYDEADRILSILLKRKERFAARRPLLASIIEKFLREGLVGRSDLDPDTLTARRHMALREARHISRILREPDIGIQVGVAREPIPSTSFQIVRKGAESTLTISWAITQISGWVWGSSPPRPRRWSCTRTSQNSFGRHR